MEDLEYDEFKSVREYQKEKKAQEQKRGQGCF